MVKLVFRVDVDVDGNFFAGIDYLKMAIVCNVSSYLPLALGDKNLARLLGVTDCVRDSLS